MPGGLSDEASAEKSDKRRKGSSSEPQWCLSRVSWVPRFTIVSLAAAQKPGAGCSCVHALRLRAWPLGACAAFGWTRISSVSSPCFSTLGFINLVALEPAWRDGSDRGHVPGGRFQALDSADGQVARDRCVVEDGSGGPRGGCVPFPGDFCTAAAVMVYRPRVLWLVVALVYGG